MLPNHSSISPRSGAPTPPSFFRRSRLCGIIPATLPPMPIHPLDDPALSALGSLAKAQRSRVTSIPNEAVGAIREDFQQFLRDAQDQPGREEPPLHQESLPQPPQEEALDLGEGLPPETYGAHGQRLPLPDAHRLDLKG